VIQEQEMKDIGHPNAGLAFGLHTLKTLLRICNSISRSQNEMLQQTCYVKLSWISKPEDYLHDEQCKTNYKYVEKYWGLRGPGSGTAGEASCWLYLKSRLTFQLLYMVFSLLVKFKNDTFRRVGRTSEEDRVHFRSKPKCLLL
jgi:hypothetical protein